MKIHTTLKSSFALPGEEHARVLRLKRLLGARSNTEVIRRSLRLFEIPSSAMNWRSERRPMYDRIVSADPSG